MRETLLTLERLLVKKRPDFFATFNKGASEGEIQQLERHFGFPVHDQFKALYRWRNGQKLDSRHYFLRIAEFLPLDIVMSEYDNNTSLLDDRDANIAFDAVNWWNWRWVPLLRDTIGAMLCLDMAGTFGGVPGQLVDFIIQDKSRDIVAPDIESWLQSYCRLLEADRIDELGEVSGVEWMEWAYGIPGYPIPAECQPANS